MFDNPSEQVRWQKHVEAELKRLYQDYQDGELTHDEYKAAKRALCDQYEPYFHELQPVDRGIDL